MIRSVTHLEGEEGKTPVAIGIRDSSIELKAKLKTEDGGQVLTLKFPK